jgi:hypothetical protein
VRSGVIMRVVVSPRAALCTKSMNSDIAYRRRRMTPNRQTSRSTAFEPFCDCRRSNPVRCLSSTPSGPAVTAGFVALATGSLDHLLDGSARQQASECFDDFAECGVFPAYPERVRYTNSVAFLKLLDHGDTS